MKTKTSSGIYRIRNIKNNRTYYGSAALSLLKRKRDHFYDLNNQKHRNTFLQNDYNKCGRDSFIFEVLFLCTPEKVLFYEQQLLDLRYDGKNQCYNMCPKAGNTLGKKHSQESKLKISKSKKRLYKTSIHPRKGKRHTSKTKNKISQSKTGSKLNDDQKLNLKTGQKMYWNSSKSEKNRNERKKRISGSKNINYDSTTYCFYNKNLDVFEHCTKHDLYTKYSNLSQPGVSSLVSGRIKTHKGWKVIKQF